MRSKKLREDAESSLTAGTEMPHNLNMIRLTNKDYIPVVGTMEIESFIGHAVWALFNAKMFHIIK